MRLAGIAVTIAAILGSFFTPQQPAPEPVPAHVGPVFAADFPDPTVLRVGATYYGYGTATAWQQPGRLFPILESKDLVHWSYVADAFSAPPAWSIGSWWAPSVLHRGGAFYLYYGATARSGIHCLAVALAFSPTGPFAKSLANPILQTQAGLAGPGGGSVVDDPRGGLWFAYHAWTAGGRSLRVDRVRIRGAALTVVPTGT